MDCISWNIEVDECFDFFTCEHWRDFAWEFAKNTSSINIPIVCECIYFVYELFLHKIESIFILQKFAIFVILQVELSKYREFIPVYKLQAEINQVYNYRILWLKCLLICGKFWLERGGSISDAWVRVLVVRIALKRAHYCLEIVFENWVTCLELAEKIVCREISGLWAHKLLDYREITKIVIK